MRVRRVLLLLAIAAVQFAVFEVALRTWGHSEAAPAFQSLFVPDPAIGYRLRPGARVRFTTAEFDTQIRINEQGVREDEPIGPKPPNERRIVVLGDSLVLAVQVDRQQTFCRLLEERLNRDGGPIRYRVINAGVQGYGPVEELLFFRHVARAFQPDLVIATVFVGNDAEEALGSAPRLRDRPLTERLSESTVTRLRRLVRRSMVLQILRLRAVAVASRFPSRGAPPEPPLQSYAEHPAPRIAEGLRITRDCIASIAAEASAVGARTMVMLMPARFQVNDDDYGHLKEAVEAAGGRLVRDGATQRFDAELASLPIPRFDALPPLRAGAPGTEVFFLQTVHLTPRGHDIVASALEAFIRRQGL